MKSGIEWSRVQQSRTIRFGSPVLAVASMPYGLGVCLRLAAYRAGLFKPRALPGFVLSVGNLTAGGAGKTPAAAMLARWALAEGHRVTILSRGYGGRYKGKVLEVSDGVRLKTDQRSSGDEPYLLALKLAGVPVVLSKKRFLAGKFARDRFDSSLFILDDGFQHLELKRDLNLALIDAINPFGNGHLLPWGPLREPIRQLKRADAFILTRAHDSSSGGWTRRFLEEKFPDRPVYSAQHLPNEVIFPSREERHRPEFLKGKPVFAFAGIAHPASFKETLEGLGADVKGLQPFMDHHPYSRKEIDAMIEKGKASGARYFMTTEKDWVRIASLALDYPNLGCLSVKFELSDGKEDFFRTLQDRIAGKNK